MPKLYQPSYIMVFEGLIGIILEPFFFLESIRESCIAIHFDFIPNSTQLFKKISYWICTLNTARP
jgi:hypothetical protein